MRQKVFVFMGGLSSEFEVSIVSGTGIVRALDVKKYDIHPLLIERDGWTWSARPLTEYQHQNFSRNYFASVEGTAMRKVALPSIKDLLPADVVFLALHGRWGEDGHVQALLEHYGVPYTGSGLLASSLAMDKIQTKMVFKANGIPTPEFCVWKPECFSKESVAGAFKLLGSTLVIKDPLGGSSLDMGFARSEDEAFALAEKFFGRFPRLLVERFVPGQEASCGFIEGLAPLPPTEVRMTTREYFDFEAKYNGEVREVTPAEFDERLTRDIQALARRAHEALDCAVYSRTDVRIDGSGNLFALETNTLPGMTPTSFLPQQAAFVGLDYPSLVDTILQKSLAVKRLYV